MIRNTTLTIALLLGTLAACAPPRPAATAGADADESPPTETAETAESPSTTTTTTTADAPVGDLVCRTTSIDGTTELYLRWSGDEATGVLRTIGPSGAVTDTRVKAERNKSVIIVDETSSTDLATHLATVGTNGNKRRMRVVEMGQARSADCE